MVEQAIHFNDGDVYERTMGVWSRLAGELFLDWLNPHPGMRWIDVGCGSGAFTELLVQRCSPAETQRLDPSEAQLAFARTRPAARGAEFLQGDAMALPFPDDRFDAAVMALVIFFVRDPAKGVAEMARVVRPGGAVAAYAWDMLGGGFPWEPIQAEMRALGVTPPLPPSVGASRMAALRDLWACAGLEAIETCEITVQRTFANSRTSGPPRQWQPVYARYSPPCRRTTPINGLITDPRSLGRTPMNLFQTDGRVAGSPLPAGQQSLHHPTTVEPRRSPLESQFGRTLVSQPS